MVAELTDSDSGQQDTLQMAGFTAGTPRTQRGIGGPIGGAYPAYPAYLALVVATAGIGIGIGGSFLWPPVPQTVPTTLHSNSSVIASPPLLHPITSSDTRETAHQQVNAQFTIHNSQWNEELMMYLTRVTRNYQFGVHNITSLIGNISTQDPYISIKHNTTNHTAGLAALLELFDGLDANNFTQATFDNDSATPFHVIQKSPQLQLLRTTHDNGQVTHKIHDSIALWRVHHFQYGDNTHDVVVVVKKKDPFVVVYVATLTDDRPKDRGHIQDILNKCTWYEYEPTLYLKSSKKS